MDALVIPVLFIVIGIITAFLASRKGYNFLLWVFCGAPFGLIILAFLPNTKTQQIEEKRQSAIKRGNVIGAIASVFSIVFTIMTLLQK